MDEIILIGRPREIIFLESLHIRILIPKNYK